MKADQAQAVTALVVDDSRSTRELLAAMLQAQGVSNVLLAEDGMAALRAIEASERPVDLVFCDLAMPVLDGVEALRGLATRHVDAAIVLLSGLDHKLIATVAEMAAQLGLHVLGTMYKPFLEDDVRSIMKEFRRMHARRLRPMGFTVTPQEVDDALRAGRIEVYYQPKIRLTDGELVGVEALARLVHPAYGLIEPDSFIPVAEHADLITPLTMSVMQQAIRQTGDWARKGLKLGISVNMSPLAIRRLDLPDLVSEMTSAAELPRSQVTLELTETQLACGPEILHIVSRFRLRDFKLSIDDYGTGHSSLKQLRNLPFTELKIDKAFVQNAAHDRDLQSILETSIELGRRLRMDVVGEGVETWADWRLLQGMGCDMAQGYVAARPIAGPGIPLWAERWHAAQLTQ